MIRSMLDDDQYKLTMHQCVFHQYPEARVTYQFTCRDRDVKLLFLLDDIKREVEKLGELTFSDEQIEYLRSLGFFQEDYLDALKAFRYMPEQDVRVYSAGDQLGICIQGSWYQTILYEVKVLAIISELYAEHLVLETPGLTFDSVLSEAYERLLKKIDLIHGTGVMFADFGTRRRFSSVWHQTVVDELLYNCPENFIGTSNIHLARETGAKSIGTQAHEYISAHLGLVDRISVAQKRAFHVWLQEYGTDLGIALSDTFTTDAFLRDFDAVLANAFDGVRQDSGDPAVAAEKIIGHYERLGIDPLEKTIVFSDSLTFQKMIDLYEKFSDRIKVVFGIGTNLTNDVGVDPLSIVIKLYECDSVPVVKLSDDVMKATGNRRMIMKLFEEYGLEAKDGILELRQGETEVLH